MTIYLDNMAATPIDPRVAERHRSAMLEHCGNPRSVEHSAGADAQTAIGTSAATISRALGSDATEVVFTPGASSALWVAVEDAIIRTSGRPARIAATAVEHPALLAALRAAESQGRIALTIAPVDATGAPRTDAIEAILDDGVDLVCTMAANNEIGTVSDLASLAALAARRGARHLVDASQAAGRIDPLAFASADLIVISGAKIYGPRRVGAILGDLTAGTHRLIHDLFGSPDAPGAAALAQAVELREAERVVDELRIAGLRDALEARLLEAVPGLVVNGSANRLAGSLHVSTPHIPGEAAVARLWGQVAVSTGAACQSGAPGPSHVLTAMGLPDWMADGAVRIGVGRFNTESEMERAADLIGAALRAETIAMSRMI